MINTAVETSFARPAKTFINMNPSIPKIIPCAMLYAKGIITMVRNAGMDSVKSEKLISRIELSINKPMMIRAGAVA